MPTRINRIIASGPFFDRWVSPDVMELSLELAAGFVRFESGAQEIAVHAPPAALSA
jgi:hypothetical protein